MHPSVREWGDAGTPVVQAAPAAPVSRVFIEIAEKLVERVAALNAERQGGLVIDRSGGVNRRLPIAR
jgi:ATP-binding protein involved in chromosome partitioning